MSSTSRTPHTIGTASALNPDIPGAYPDQDSASEATPVAGQLPDVLTFEAWMAGAGLSGTTDYCVESDR